MLQWFVLVPVLLPVAFSALFLLPITRAFVRSRPWIPLALIPAEIVLLLLNVLPFEHKLIVSDWATTAFTITLELDGVAISLLLLIYVLMGALWLIIPAMARIDLTTGFVLLSASIMILAANVPTIYVGWILLDASILAWRLSHDIERGEALRSFVTSQVGALMLFVGAQLLGSGYEGRGTLLIGLAYWARLGIFPFHWVYPLRGIDSRDLWFSRAIPLLAGSALWLRWSVFGAQPPGQVLAIIGLFAIIASAVWMWHEEQPSRAVIHGVWHAVPFIPLAVSYGGESGNVLALWTTVSLAFALVLFELGLRWRARNQNYWISIFWILGILTLAGIPLTPAFAGRMGTYSFFIESGNAWLLVVLSILVALILGVLMRYSAALEGAEPRGLDTVERAGIVLLLVLFAVCTLGALPLALGLGTPISDSTSTFLAFSEDNAAFLVIALVALLIPLGIAFLLQRANRFLASHRGRTLSGLAGALELSWLERLATGMGYQVGTAVRNVTTIAEENPTVWILLVALWLAILTVIPR